MIEGIPEHIPDANADKTAGAEIPTFEYPDEQRDPTVATAPVRQVTSDVTGYSKTDEYPGGRSHNGEPHFTRAQDFYDYAEQRDAALRAHIGKREAQAVEQVTEPQPEVDPKTTQVAEKAGAKGWFSKLLRKK